MKKQFYQKYNIIVCGTGATGSQLIPFLTQLLSYHENCSLVFIDGDRVETKNLKNQKFLNKDNGLPKARILQQRYSTVYPNLGISYMDEYLQNAQQMLDLLSQNPNTLNIIIGCVDNNPTRKILMDVFHNPSAKQLVYIDSGNGTTSMQGQIVIGYKTVIGISKKNMDRNGITLVEDTKIMSPCAGDIFSSITNDTETVDHVTSCSYVGDKNPQNIATNIMAASTIFNIIIQIIEFGNILTGITYFDAKNQEVNFREIAQQNYKDLKCEVVITADDIDEECELEIIDTEFSMEKNSSLTICGAKLDYNSELHFCFQSQRVSVENNEISISLEESTVGTINNDHELEFLSGVIMEYINTISIDSITVCDTSEERYLKNAKVKSLTFSYGDETIVYDKSKDILVNQYDVNGYLIGDDE